MFGDEQPHAGQIATHFVRQQLPYPPFDRQGITVLKISPITTDLRFHEWFGFLAWTALIEFFFEDRIQRSRVRHSAY